MTLEDYDKFTQTLSEWLDNISVDMSREIISELNETLGRVSDPLASEKLVEIKQILRSVSYSWEERDYETAGCELDRLRERL